MPALYHFSPQVMFAQRGFVYYSSNSFNTGNVLVPMKSAGINPTTATVNNALNAFIPYLQPETNSTSTTEIKASATQSPLAGLLTRAASYMKTVSTSSGSCPQKNTSFSSQMVCQPRISRGDTGRQSVVRQPWDMA